MVFQDHFANTGLFTLKSAAADLRYSFLGCCNTNPISTIFFVLMWAFTRWQTGMLTHKQAISLIQQFQIHYILVQRPVE